MFFDKTLFREDLIHNVEAEFADSFLFQIRNSPVAIMLLLDVIKNNLEYCDFALLFGCFRNQLSRKRFLTLSPGTNSFEIECFRNGDRLYKSLLTPSNDFFDYIYSDTSRLLTAKFFYYYASRLPIVFRETTFYGRKISDKEEKRLICFCINRFEELFQDLIIDYRHIFSASTVCYDLTREVNKARSFFGLLGKSKNKAEFAYDYHWIFSGPSALEKGLIVDIGELSSNLKFVLFKTLDEYFNVFIESMTDEFIRIATMKVKRS